MVSQLDGSIVMHGAVTGSYKCMVLLLAVTNTNRNERRSRQMSNTTGEGRRPFTKGQAIHTL